MNWKHDLYFGLLFTSLKKNVIKLHERIEEYIRKKLHCALDFMGCSILTNDKIVDFTEFGSLKVRFASDVSMAELHS